MKLRKIAALILAAVLMLTLCVTFVHAEEGSDAIVDSSAEVVDSSAKADSSAVVGSSATDKDDDTKTEEKTPNWDAIIAGGIVLLAALVLVVIYFVSPKFKEKVNKFFRDHRSELKKVVWSPARDVKNNTVVVVVFALGFAIVIGVLDFIFSKGILALGPVIKKLISLL